MFYFNKKTTDIAIAHVVVQLFFMPLFSIMSTLKYQFFFILEHILTSLDTTNNTTTCPLMGVGSEHCKAPPPPKKKKSSNFQRKTPTLQSQSNQKKTTSTKPTRKHEQAQLHPQGPRIVNLSQKKTTSNRQTNEPVNKKQPPNQ
jgi:hypothetical protein